MVRVALQICANLENIEEIKASHPDYTYLLRVTCTNCGETSNRWHDVSESLRTNQDSRNPKGFSFLMKCKMCGRENSIDIVEKSNVSYNQKFNNQFQTIVVFDCRGAEPVEFAPQTGWIAQSVDSGQTFEDVDLSEREWVDYDEKNKQSVGVYEFASKFIKLKK